jgi:hypothetical protein
LENGDKWAKQTFGAFVESAEMSFPGDGQAQTTWSGSAKSSNLVGIGKSTVDNSLGNTVTLQAGEGKRFRLGAHVMLIEANGSTRSADTPDGSALLVTGIAGDVITLSGAALADADGSVTPVFLSYYEPATPTAINEPQVGLVGSIVIAGFSALDCVRSATISCANNHELQDNCFGEEGLGGNLFIPGGRFTAAISLEINMNETLLELLNKIRDDISGESVTLILGDSSTRRLEITIPQAIFQVPEIGVPDTGPIPVTLSGNAYQSGIDVADEISIHYK